jgi:hypothetical protein
MIVRRLTFALCLAVIPGIASAHGPGRGPNGGQMQDLAGSHVELMAKDSELVLYLFDAENKPLSAKGATATATVLTAGQQETVILVAGDDNAIRGKGRLTTAPGMKVIVSLTLPGQRAQSGRFTPLY